VPVYDYVCASCGHRFEVLRGLNESGPHQCPLCEGPVSRAFAPPTIVFKGSGWAKNDRRSSGAPTKKAAAGESKGSEPASGEPASGDAKSGDSKSGESKSGESKSDGSAPTSSGDSKSRDSASTSSGSGD